MPEQAVIPRYTMDRPNSEVALYQGLLRVTSGERHIECSGSISLRWEPFPRLVVEFEVEGFQEELERENPLEVEAVEIGGKGTGLLLALRSVMNVSSGWKQSYSGVIWEFLVGSPAATEEVIFHVANFPRYFGTFVENTDEHGTEGHWAGRLDISTDRWRTILDLSTSARDASWWDQFSAQGGYALTHVGRLTRTDSTEVAFEDLEVIQPLLKMGLSMLRSERTEPALYLGIHDGETVWELWRAPDVAPWFGPESWMPHTQLVTFTPPEVDAFQSIFNTLASSFGDRVERSGLTRAINWYTQGIESRLQPVANKVIFAQAGLELMSWMRIVKDGVLDSDGFRKLDAAESLRLALELIGVERNVPDTLSELFAATRSTGKGLRELDGPASITEIRNGTLHPEEKQRLSDDAVVQRGAALALRYLELLLLRRLGYSGLMRNRTRSDFSPEAVPWSK